MIQIENCGLEKSETNPKQNIQKSLYSTDNTNHSIACHKISDIAILDQKEKKLDLNVVKTHLFNQGKLSEAQVYKILNDADTILRSENNLLEIEKPCHVVGDIHGQFYDLIYILDHIDLKNESVLFLGDYVDRGSFSVETYLYLMLIKTYFPNNVFILRGNHESKRITSYFTFKTECTLKYNQNIYDRIIESFKTLPMAAVIQKSAFCCHGGISPFLKSIYDLNTLNRFREIEYSGLFCDIFWSDPHPNFEELPGSQWDQNKSRKCSFYYNYDNVVSFLQKNSLKMIIRGHEVQESGFKLNKSYNDNPSVVTIFSAPKYCDVYNNKGAIIKFDKEIVAIKQFDGVAHPFVLNGFLDGINWSLPFISEKLIDFSVALFEELYKIEIMEDSDDVLAKMAIMRVERECIDEFEETDHESEDIMLNTSEIEQLDFKEAKRYDAKNEAKKDEYKSSDVSISLSPSLKGEVINTLSNMNLNKPVKNQEITIEEIPDSSIKHINLNCDKKQALKPKSKHKIFCGFF